MDFSFDSFSACLNDSFALLSGDARIELTLIGVDRHPAPADSTHPASFSIVFQSPPGPVLAQQMYRLSHAKHGEFDLFIVPIGQDDNGVRYEAVFS